MHWSWPILAVPGRIFGFDLRESFGVWGCSKACTNHQDPIVFEKQGSLDLKGSLVATREVLSSSTRAVSNDFLLVSLPAKSPGAFIHSW